jgi:hypothetical protein
VVYDLNDSGITMPKYKVVEKACRKCRHWVPYTYPYGYLPDKKIRKNCDTWLYIKTKCPIWNPTNVGRHQKTK